jgi:hypothetical protein
MTSLKILEHLMKVNKEQSEEVPHKYFDEEEEGHFSNKEKFWANKNIDFT